MSEGSSGHWKGAIWKAAATIAAAVFLYAVPAAEIWSAVRASWAWIKSIASATSGAIGSIALGAWSLMTYSVSVPLWLAALFPAGAQAGEKRLRHVFMEAGFSQFRRATETPFNLVLEARK
jgi:hypothetical protein